MTDSINVPTKGACTDGFAGYVITPAGEELVASPEMTTNGIRGAVNAMFNDIIEASDGDWGDDLQMGFDTILAEHDAAIASLESQLAALTKEREDDQRQLLIAEGVTEKLSDNNQALRAENASLKRIAWSVLDGFPRHLDCQCGLCKLRDALASLPPTETEI